MKKSGIFALCMSALMLWSCSARTSVSDADTSDIILEEEVSDLTPEAFEWADSVMQTMSLHQRVSQMVMPALYARDDYWTVRQIVEYADSCIGGIILLKGDSRGAAILADTMMRVGKIPSFIAIDAEWGLAMRLKDAPEFPLNSRISEDVDDRVMFDYGAEVAREAREVGINMVLGPVVDVSGVNGIMKKRSLNGDARRVADLSVAYAHGLESGNVISVAKHFPGHGSVSTDSHKAKGVISRSLVELDSIDLYPFRRWIEEDLSAVMVGHLAVPAIDPEMRPAAFSATVVTDLLKNDMGFSGLVITDALSMKGAENYSAADAIKAGADIVLAPAHTYREIDNVCKAVEEKIIDEATIEASVRKILFYKYLVTHNAMAPSAKLHLRYDKAEADSISHLLTR